MLLTLMKYFLNASVIILLSIAIFPPMTKSFNQHNLVLLNFPINIPPHFGRRPRIAPPSLHYLLERMTTGSDRATQVIMTMNNNNNYNVYLKSNNQESIIA